MSQGRLSLHAIHQGCRTDLTTLPYMCELSKWQAFQVLLYITHDKSFIIQALSEWNCVALKFLTTDVGTKEPNAKFWRDEIARI